MCPTPDSTSADLQQTIADLQRRLAEARAERDESEAQKGALAEVLGVINASPGDLEPCSTRFWRRRTVCVTPISVP